MTIKTVIEFDEFFNYTKYLKNLAKLVGIRKRNKAEHRSSYETEINWKERAFSIECMFVVMTDLFSCDYFRPETITKYYKIEFTEICESLKNEQYQNCEGTSNQKLYDILKKFKSQHDRHWSGSKNVFQDYFITMSTPVKRRRSEMRTEASGSI